MMDIDIKDPRFLAIVDENLERETISEDFQFTEGPIWHPLTRPRWCGPSRLDLPGS